MNNEAPGVMRMRDEPLRLNGGSLKEDCSDRMGIGVMNHIEACADLFCNHCKYDSGKDCSLDMLNAFCGCFVCCCCPSLNKYDPD